MKQLSIFGILLVGFFTFHTTPTLAAEKLALPIENSEYTLFAIPFSISHQKSVVIVPTTARRDVATATSIGYTLKTPEGLRHKAGLAVGTVLKNSNSDEYTLYVLYKDQTPTTRVNTLAITHLPFLLISEKTGTTSQALNKSELRNFAVKNPNIKPLTDVE